MSSLHTVAMAFLHKASKLADEGFNDVLKEHTLDHTDKGGIAFNLEDLRQFNEDYKKRLDQEIKKLLDKILDGRLL